MNESCAETSAVENRPADDGRSGEPLPAAAFAGTSASEAAFAGTSVLEAAFAGTSVLEAAFAAMPDGFGILARCDGADGGGAGFRWMHVNPSLSRLLGAAGAPGRLLADAANGGGRGLVALVGAASHDSAPREQILALAGGHCRVAAQGFDFPADGGPAAHVSVTVTPFAATRGADPLRVALEHCQDAVALFDADDRLVDATGRMKELFPEIAEGLVPGAFFADLLVHYCAAAGVDNRDAAGWQAAGDWVARRLARRRQNGGEDTLRTISGRWLRNREWRTADGGVISIYTDVTTYKQQEEKLLASEAAALAAKQAAEKASRAKSEFLTHMSHELRTPLNAIIGFAELMELETLGPLGHRRYLDYAHDILDSGRRLLSLVEDTLDLSRIDAGRLNLVEEMIDLREAAAAAVGRFTDRGARAGVALLIDAPEHAPLLVGDRRAIHQMLDHLVSNALKFTPSGGSVMISVNPTPDGGLGLMVGDTGCGIAEEDLERVVRPFGRTEMSVSHCIDGTGLGLPIVKRLVELHGGRLELDSVVGVGTTAILMFPAQRVATASGLLAPRVGRPP